MKECNVDQCMGYHEGFCVMDLILPGFDPETCTTKCNADLITGDLDGKDDLH